MDPGKKNMGITHLLIEYIKSGYGPGVSLYLLHEDTGHRINWGKYEIGTHKTRRLRTDIECAGMIHCA